MPGDELEVPSDYGNGSGRLSRGSSSQNIFTKTMADPALEMMQRRIDDLDYGFKHLDRITDEIDYDIETVESMLILKLLCSFALKDFPLILLKLLLHKKVLIA